MCAPSVAPIAHRLHCQISIIIQAAVLYIAHFAQQGRSWNRYRMFLTDCDAADRKNDKHNSRLTGCHHVVRCQLCQAACAPFFSVDLLTNHKSRHRCPDGRPQERMSASEWREVISHRRRPSLFFWKTGKQIIHHREYTGGCDGTTRSRSPLSPLDDVKRHKGVDFRAETTTERGVRVYLQSSVSCFVHSLSLFC